MIVPTGIGAAIGGYAGDALPVARTLSSVVDCLIAHPNVRILNFKFSVLKSRIWQSPSLPLWRWLILTVAAGAECGDALLANAECVVRRRLCPWPLCWRPMGSHACSPKQGNFGNWNLIFSTHFIGLFYLVFDLWSRWVWFLIVASRRSFVFAICKWRMLRGLPLACLLWNMLSLTLHCRY